jgi:hypothetical protein
MINVLLECLDVSFHYALYVIFDFFNSPAGDPVTWHTNANSIYDTSSALCDGARQNCSVTSDALHS